MRVREGCEKAYLRGRVGRVAKAYSVHDRVALHVCFEDGLWQLLWPQDVSGREGPYATTAVKPAGTPFVKGRRLWRSWEKSEMGRRTPGRSEGQPGFGDPDRRPDTPPASSPRGGRLLRRREIVTLLSLEWEAPFGALRNTPSSGPSGRDCRSARISWSGWAGESSYRGRKAGVRDADGRRELAGGQGTPLATGVGRKGGDRKRPRDCPGSRGIPS